MADDPKGDDKKKREGNALVPAGDAKDLIPEIVAAVREEGAQVDVNVLLVNLAEKPESSQQLIKSWQEALEIAEKFEDHRLKTFQKRAEALIKVKENDPDEIEKRTNNATRRYLKYTIAGCAVFCIGGGILSIALGTGIVVAGSLVISGGIALAMLGPLASGESVSSNDIVRSVNAFRPKETAGRQETASTRRRNRGR